HTIAGCSMKRLPCCGARQQVKWIFTSSAVVAEVAFLLTSRNVYAMNVDDAVARLEPVLGIPNLVIDRKADVLRALHVWSERPAMGFVDALLVAMAESLDAPVATFDHGFTRFGTIGRHVWRAES